MKIKLYIAVVAAFILSACQALNFDNIVGQPIRFRATMADNGLTTRTIYSGEGDWSDGLFKERINWTDDDDVIVYMDWEQVSGVSAIPDPEANHYYYYNVSPTGNGDPEYIHRGTLSAKEEQAGKSLTWKGDKDKNVIFNHYFYSVYPATCADRGSAGINYKNPNDVSFTFTLPSDNADNMRYAYMAAVAEAVQTKHTGKDGPSPYSKAIDLNYYPMITTLYVTLVNESNRAEGEIKVSISPTEENKRNSRNPLYGEYTIKLDNNKGFDEYYNNEIFYDKETVAFDNDNEAYGTSSYTYVFNDETPSVEGKQYISIPFFVRPREYNEDIVLTVGNQDFHLYYEFKPFRKYNITVKLTGASPDEPDPSDPPTIEDISDGGAQMLSVLIKKLAENGTLKQYLKECYPNSGKNFDDDNTFWNPFNNSMINGGLSNVTATSFFNKLKELLGDDWIKLLEMIVDRVEEIDLPDVGGGIPSDIEAKDFKIFRNITSIKTKAKGSVDIPELPNLKTVELEYATDISITNCPQLSDLKLGNLTNLKKISIDNCGITSFKYEGQTSNAVYEFKNMPDLTSIILNGAKEVHVSNCGLSSFSARDPWGNPTNYEILEFIDMDNLISIDASNTKTIIVQDCKELQTIQHNGTVQNKGGCPKLTNY